MNEYASMDTAPFEGVILIRGGGMYPVVCYLAVRMAEIEVSEAVEALMKQVK